MTTTEERQSPTAGQRAAKAGAKHLGRKIGWILGAKIGFWVAVVLVLLLLVMAAGAQVANTTTTNHHGGRRGHRPGRHGMGRREHHRTPCSTDSAFPDVAAVQAALDRDRRPTAPPRPACAWTPTGRSLRRRSGARTRADQRQARAVRGHPVPPGPGVRHQPAGRDRDDPEGIPGPHPAHPPAALTGFGCPDTGPGGSANCDAGAGGVGADLRHVPGLRAAATRTRRR